ncbi:hypothetical protein BDP27DRAFT_1247081 [Rhodocollybia butyracea]|uniref:Uncharacterized protein n=1 Tax=Rhodocollybia butyracea TaxID=206335 RepID=A0A9P5P6U3_9AGAR|nr:hypothetical protein BDP27DRAFT_1247081 [Rhodocollybia butyracea]
MLQVIELELLEEFELKDRSKCGIQNNITGGLLCPVEFDWDNSMICTAIQNFENNFDFASSACACRLYTDSIFNPNDLDKGFLKSHLLLQVYQVIFTSPSSAKNQSSNIENLPPSKKTKTAKISSRGPVSKILHMSEVTPHSIAYAAVHLHFGLLDAPHWCCAHNSYNYQDLWNYVVNFFEDPVDEDAECYTEELLKWWNEYIVFLSCL